MNFSIPFLPDSAVPFIARSILDIAIYGTFALSIALLIERFWKSATASDRHGLWLLALLAGTLGPLLSHAVIASVSSKGDLSEGITIRYDLHQNGVTQPSPLTTPRSSRVAPAASHPDSPLPPESGASSKPRPTITLTPDSSRALASTAVIGSLLLFIRMLLGIGLLRRLGRRSRPLGDEEWQQLLARLRKRLGIRRSIDLRVHPSETIPLTWGHRRPVVLLPNGASQWSEERREAVLLHELAHIRRWDCTTHSLATLLRAVAWFHPLSWIALRRLSLEREQACDDWVINSGNRPSGYAEHLLELSRACTAQPTHGAIAMAQPHRLSTRVTAILDPRRHRSGSPFRVALVGCALVLGTALPRPTVLASEAANPPSASTNAPARPSPTRAELAERGLRNIELALAASQERQQRLNSELDDLKEKLGITDLMLDRSTQGATPPAEGLQITKLEQLSQDILIRIAREDSKLSRLKALPASVIPEVLLTLYPEDQMLQHLSIRKETAESEVEMALARHGADSSEHKTAMARVQSYQKKLDDRIEGILRSLEIQLETSRMELNHLSKASQDAKQAALERAPAYRRYFEKKRELENERVMGDVLMRKIAQERFDAHIPRAQPPIPVPDSPLQRP